MTWQEAVLGALDRFSKRHKTRRITRQQLIDEELDSIIRNTNSQGATPSQTLSRVLQELRDENILYFASDGVYVLFDTPINIEEEELSEDTIDFAIKQKKLHIGFVSTDDLTSLTRRRKGQGRIRELTIQNYGAQCALCDITDQQLLITSHISRWADDLEGRGDLSNIICLCKFHDALFESGYLSFSDDLKILKKSNINSRTINQILDLITEFKLPKNNTPGSNYLRKHRIRTGFESQL